MQSLPVCGVFVGRAAELAALHSARTDPDVHTVLISGEAGLGKSRLVREFTTRAGAETVVLTGRCPEFGSDGMPFAVFVSVLRALVRTFGAAQLAELLPVDRPALAHWLPELAIGAGDEPGETDRIRLFGEILTLLERSAVARPLIVVLEDLHWADDSSRDLLAFLVANLAQPGVLLVGTYRPGPDEPLRRLVTELRRNPGVRLVRPQSLTRHEVGRQLAALLGTEPSPELVARIFQRSTGNPLFVEALSHAPEDTPADLAELLLGYQSDLPAEARAVLRISAVAGSVVSHALLEYAAGLAEDALHRALRTLIDQQLFRAVESGYEFRHILIRDAIYQDMLPIERKRLHAKLSQAPDTDLAARAHHAYAAADLPRAFETSWGAAMNADAVGAPREQQRHLERMLELWDRVPDADIRVGVDRLSVLERLADACLHGGGIERGIAAADQALDSVDAAGAPERAARLYHVRAILKNQSGIGGSADLTRALALLPARPPTMLRGEILAELAIAHLFTGDSPRAHRHARAAVEIAEQLDAPALTARAFAYLGLATAEHDSGTAIASFERAHTAATAASPQSVVTVALWEAAIRVAAGDHLAAIEAVQHGLRAAHESFRFAEAAPILLVKWAQALTALGRWAEATQLIEEAMTDQVPPLSRAALLLCQATIALAQGDSAAARHTADTARDLLGDGSWAAPYRIQLQHLRYAIARADGRTRDATQVLTEIRTADNPAAHPRELWALLALAARNGDLTADLGTLATALPVTSPVDRAHQSVVTAVGDGSPAAWHTAVTAWQALQQPVELAECLLGATEAALAAGDRTAAQQAVRAAATSAAQLPPTPLAERIQHLATRARLSLTPGTPPTPQPPATFGLTARELEVLRLVATGLSNRQIAAELFISSNTAGVHVSRILTKLGVSTRTEATTLAHTHHLLAKPTN